MKEYNILKSFKGSQDGRHTVPFEAGTKSELSDTLAEIAVNEGWAEPVGKTIAVDNKAVQTIGAKPKRKTKG